MKMKETELPGVHILEPAIHEDNRGKFLELWNAEWAASTDVLPEFIQDNLSYSSAGCLRGLHFQYPTQQGKLVAVMSGQIFDVAVDVRRGSPTYGRWVGLVLDDKTNRQIWLPRGFAHGYLALSEQAVVLYRIDAPYRPEEEYVVAYDDPALNIEWPCEVRIMNNRDRNAPRLDELHALPTYESES